MGKAFEGVEQLRAQADMALARSLGVPVEVIGFEMFNVDCGGSDLWEVTRLHKNERGFQYAALRGVQCPYCGQEVMLMDNGQLPVHTSEKGQPCIIADNDWRE